MSLFTDRKDFFKLLATIHYEVRHDELIAGGNGMKRKSFIHIDNPEEITAAVMNQLHVPCVAHINFEGKPINRKDSIRVRIANELLFLDKVATTTLLPTKEKAYAAALERSFNVMMDFISYMHNEYEEKERCGPFEDIDLNLFSWRMQDDYSDGFVGWTLTWADEVKATDLLGFDENKWIAIEP